MLVIYLGKSLHGAAAWWPFAGLTRASPQRQGIQFVISRNVEQHRSQVSRVPLAEYFFKAPLGGPPQPPRSAQRRPAFLRQLDVTFSPIGDCEAQNQQVIPLQGSQVVA